MPGWCHDELLRRRVSSHDVDSQRLAWWARGAAGAGAGAVGAARIGRPVRPPRYRVAGWMVVFPLGMYATAGLVLGTAVRLPLIHHIGAVAVWPAAAAWALTTIAMAAAALTRRRVGRAEPGTAAPARRRVALLRHR
jgi:hypothetical protein